MFGKVIHSPVEDWIFNVTNSINITKDLHSSVLVTQLVDLNVSTVVQEVFYVFVHCHELGVMALDRLRIHEPIKIMDANWQSYLVAWGHLNFILLLERNLLIICSLRVVVLLEMDPSLPLRPQMADKVKSVLIVMDHIILIETVAIWPKNYGLLPVTFVWRLILLHILFAFVLVLNFNFDGFSVHLCDLMTR